LIIEVVPKALTLPNERTTTMSETTTRLDRTEEAPFTLDVSDEVLEIAGSSASALVNFTLGGCTGLTACPA
jgi:hypothetical protein